MKKDKELHKVHNAQQTAIEAVEKLEPLQWELWNLQKEYRELNQMGFIMQHPQKLTCSSAAPRRMGKTIKQNTAKT